MSGLYEKQVVFYGKHAKYMKELKENGLFKTYFDIFRLAPIVAFIDNRTEKEDKDKSSGDVTIFADILIEHSEDLEIIYKLIMLLDNERELSEDVRINRAFKDFYNEEQRELGKKRFKEYVLAGISILYDFFIIKDGDEKEKIDNFITRYSPQSSVSDLIDTYRL